MSKVKDKAKATKETTQTVVQNVGEFLDAISFTVVALFTVFTAFDHRDESYWYKALLLAGLVVSFQAFRLLVRHFNKKG